MRATEFIAELFQPGKNWQWEFRGSEEAFASFKVGDVEYIWHAHSKPRDPKSWIIEFKTRDEVDQDKSFGLTGAGNAAGVMSTVVDITRTFLEQYKDNVMELAFLAKEESRASLYAKMIKRLLPDWNLYQRNKGGTEFYLTNPRAYELGEETAQSPMRWTGDEVYRKIDSTMTSSDLEEDMTRRGFLGGLAGLAAGAASAKQMQPAQQPVSHNLLSNNPNNEIAMLKAAKKAGLKGQELAQFMAQMKHESWDFERLKEKPQPGVKGYFAKKYDPKFAPKTAKILGNKHIGDGERYHGRGFVQLTGRDNYRMAGQALGIDLLNHPELAAKPEVAAQIAVWYWNTRVKPYVRNFADTRAVTQKINPAAKGLVNRHENFQDYMRII